MGCRDHGQEDTGAQTASGECPCIVPKCRAAARSRPWAGMGKGGHGCPGDGQLSPGEWSTGLQHHIHPSAAWTWMLSQPPFPCLQPALQHPAGQDLALAEQQVLQSLWRPCLRCINMERNSLFFMSPFKGPASKSRPDGPSTSVQAPPAPQSPKGLSRFRGPRWVMLPGRLQLWLMHPYAGALGCPSNSASLLG